MEDYQTQQSVIADKARKNGITTEELNAVFERMLENVIKEHGGKSKWFRLENAEGLVWGHFFPGEPFPTARPVTSSRSIVQYSDDPISPFPKALHRKEHSSYEEAARREWVHDRYQPESPAKIDSYRPKVETDSYRPGPVVDWTQPLVLKGYRDRPVLGLAAPRSELYKKREAAFVERNEKGEKEKGALKDLSINGDPRPVEERVGQDPFMPSSNDDVKIYRSQSKFIQQQARDAGISMFKIEDCFEEKAAIAEKKFADYSRDWQMYFVEASVWGRYFTSPFPGIEPPKYIAQDPVNVPTDVPTGKEQAEGGNAQFEGAPHRKASGFPIYSARMSEAHMEALAFHRGLRREFFQYLQKMRDYTSLIHKDAQCNYIKGWFADNLTWQKFFGPKPYPFAQPYGKENVKCTPCLLLPMFAPIENATMKKVTKSITDSGHGSLQKQQIKSISKVVGTPTAPLGKKKEGVSAKQAPVVNAVDKRETQPITRLIPTRSAISTNTAQLQAGPVLPRSRPAQEIQSMNMASTGAPASRRSLRTPPPGFSAPIPSSRPEGDFLLQSSPPLHMTTQLAQMWARDPFIAKGTVVMQNTAPAIYNKTFIGELFSCFLSDQRQTMLAIGEELKCTIHYYVTSTGDLFLWTEPVTPGDTVSFNRGHMFLTGWVTRVSSFGMVKPSVHWNAIRTPLAPLRAQPSQILPPVDTAGTLRRLSNYVQAATSDQRKQPVADTSESTKMEASAEIEPTLADTPMTDGTESEPELKKSDNNNGPQGAIRSERENPEKQWERYKVAFRTSDLDRLMVEEAAKNEGDLRMVLDKKTGEIVSVEELVKRTVYRCEVGKGKAMDVSANLGWGVEVNMKAGDGRGGNWTGWKVTGASFGGKKRKADDEDGDGEDGREEKRTCV